MSILTIIFTKATKTIKKYNFILLGLHLPHAASLRSSVHWIQLLHHVLCTTDDVIKGPVNMEKTCPGYVEGSLACPSYRGKSQLLLRISLQNVTNCCMTNKTLARLFRWPCHPPSLANFSPCKHFNSPWLGQVNAQRQTIIQSMRQGLISSQLRTKDRPFFQPDRTADISRRHWHRSTTQIWVVTRHQYGFLRPFLRLHVAGKSLVASPNVGCFLKLIFCSYKGSLKLTWLGGEGEPLYKDNFSTRKRDLTCVEERDLYHALPEWMPAFSQTGKRKIKTHVILIKSCFTGYAVLIVEFLIEMELSKCLAKE